MDFRTTVAPMGGAFFVPLAVEHREAAGVQVRSASDALAHSHRKEWVRWVEEVKTPETRAARIEKTVEWLHAGKRTR